MAGTTAAATVTNCVSSSAELIMFQLTPADFNFTQGNENPLSGLSLTNREIHLTKTEGIFNFVIFNHNKKEFYVSRTNVAQKRLRTWLNLLHGRKYGGGIPDVLHYSLTQECLPRLCICVTENTEKTLEILDSLEKQGWQQLSKQHKQARMKTKKVNLFKIVDDTTGFTRYTLSAARSNNVIMQNVRITAGYIANGQKLKGMPASDIIGGEILRIANKNLYCKVKTTHVYHIKDKGITDVCEKEFIHQVVRLNDLALNDWLSGPYVKALLNKEGVLNREA